MDLLILAVLLLDMLITLMGFCVVAYLLFHGSVKETVKYSVPTGETTQESPDALELDDTVPLDQFTPDPHKPLKFVIKEDETGTTMREEEDGK